MTPLVSVVMPSFNQGAFIRDAIDSVLQQTYGALELIIVDNFSKDNTATLIESFKDPRIRVYRFANNGIIAAARNFGAQRARGQLLAFIDSDDIWLPGKLERQVPHLLDSGDTALVASVATLFGHGAYWRAAVAYRPGEAYRDYSYQEIALANTVVTSSVLLRKDDFEAVAGFDTDPRLVRVEDWDLWLRLLYPNRCARVLSEPLVKYRLWRNPGHKRREAVYGPIAVIEKQAMLNRLCGSRLRLARGNSFIRTGKALLDLDDRRGLWYYSLGLFESAGLANKLRALAGIMLFSLPPWLRRRALDRLYERFGHVVNNG